MASTLRSASMRNLSREFTSELWMLPSLRRTWRYPNIPTVLRSQARTFKTTSALPHNPSPPSSAHTSVDPTEVTHFNALASTWWDPHGPSRVLHLMNPLRHQFISDCRSSQPDAPSTEPLRYLDIGCGGGIFTESAARLPTTASVTGIDPTPEVLSIAKAHARQDPLLIRPGKLSYLNTSIENLPTPKSEQEGYDIVSLFEVLEHVSTPSAFLTECMTHVKPGGWLILSTIARTWTSWAITIAAAEYAIGMVPRGTHDWKKYVNEEELRRWFAQQEGWGSPRAMGVVYVPGLGWREVRGSEGWGNYFFGVRKLPKVE